ncbi:MAG: VanW family protein [Clostridiales bacterium]|nr:VanW family protein [Clostridiales bacterium]
MKKIFILSVIALAIIASVFVCSGVVYAETLSPWNVQFEVVYQGDVFRYSLQDEIDKLHDKSPSRGFYLGYAGKKEIYDSLTSKQLPEMAVYEYLLPNFSKVIAHFNYVCKDRVDATVSFGKNGFSYSEGHDGVDIDAKALFERALNSRGKLLRVSLPLTWDKATTVAQLKKNTVKRASFTTTYANSNANRCYNIAKAAEAINGVTVGVGETFSFNQVVGDRSEQRGYKISKVILDGNYTEGVGGGVCQVSTTLYNALLLAGFVPRAVQHSLISTYVKAGFDAMVSYGAADLTFVNDTNHPIYIAATTANKSVTFTVYGEPNPYRIERVSVEERDKFSTTFVVDSEKYPELVYTDQTKVVTSGSDGVKTQSYLEYYLGDRLVERKLIRKNSYKRVDQVIARGALERSLSEGQVE